MSFGMSLTLIKPEVYEYTVGECQIRFCEASLILLFDTRASYQYEKYGNLQARTHSARLDTFTQTSWQNLGSTSGLTQIFSVCYVN